MKHKDPKKLKAISRSKWVILRLLFVLNRDHRGLHTFWTRLDDIFRPILSTMKCCAACFFKIIRSMQCFLRPLLFFGLRKKYRVIILCAISSWGVPLQSHCGPWWNEIPRGYISAMPELLRIITSVLQSSSEWRIGYGNLPTHKAELVGAAFINLFTYWQLSLMTSYVTVVQVDLTLPADRMILNLPDLCIGLFIFSIYIKNKTSWIVGSMV